MVILLEMDRTIGQVRYDVTARLTSPEVREEYVAWLRGHVREVIGAGALRTSVLVMDEHLEVTASYTFAGRGALERYLEEHAPRLRADGLARFGGRATMRRSVGEVVDVAEGAA